MKILLAILNVQLFQAVSGQDCSGTYDILPDLERRSRNYSLTGNESYVSDDKLVSKWYNVSHYNMPTHSQPLYSCGTYLPIWMNGSVPSSSDKTVTRKACEVITSNCSTEREIGVVNCVTFMLYKLARTNTTYTGYCFDPFEPVIDNRNVSVSTTYSSTGSGNISATPSVHLPTCEESKDGKGGLWNITFGNVSVTKACPSGFIGNVTRFCSAHGMWETPNYGCVNKTLILLKNEAEKFLNGITTTEMSTFLSKLKDATDPLQMKLQEAEIETVVYILDKVVGINTSADIPNSTHLYENFLKTASNVIDENTSPSWQDLIWSMNKGAETVIRSVERFLERIANSVNKDGRRSNFTFGTDNIDVEIGYQLPLEFPRNTSTQGERTVQTGFVLPVLMDNNYTYAAAFYRNMSAILRKRIIQHREAVDMSGRIDIGPEVLSLQLIPNPEKLVVPLQLRFKSFDTKYSKPFCSYWMFNTTAEGDGAWSSDGCHVVYRNSSFISCVCSHLTNFAILMAPFEVIDPKHDAALSIISVVGCAVSLTCLMLTILAHLIFWRQVKSRRAYILMNICVALLLSYSTFLAGARLTENKAICMVIAALLHYLFLTVFFLMLVQGIWIAVSVLNPLTVRSFRQWLLPLGWFIPMVIVGASLGLTRLHGYGNENFCWLSVTDGVIWSFVGPAALVMVINGIIIVTVLRKMLNTTALLTKTKKERARASLRGLGVMLPLTGITWSLGIFSLSDELVVFQYLFTILNSTQGLFVFLYHCVWNKDVRKAINVKCSRYKVMETFSGHNDTSTIERSYEMRTGGGSGLK